MPTPAAHTPPTTPRPPRKRRAAATVALAAAVTVLTGCEVDGWLFDQSVTGRWENTPTIVPILERIDVIEADTGTFVDVTQVTPADLIPEPQLYLLQPGDFVVLTLFSLFVPDSPYIIEATLDEQGQVDIPNLGRITLAGLTSGQAREALGRLMQERGIVIENPIVDVQARGRQGATFSVFGAVANPGRFAVPAPDHRLLTALTEAGGVSPIIREVFIIRQVPLDDAVAGTAAPQPTRTRPAGGPGIGQPVTPEQNDGGTTSVLDLINELENENRPDPGFVGLSTLPDRNPPRRQAGTDPAPSAYQPADLQDGQAPPIDLIDDGGAPEIDLPDGPAIPLADADAVPGTPRGEWRFIGGQWMQVMPRSNAEEGGLPEGADPLDGEVTAEDLVTQRVIEVPTGPLLQGVARFNIVIRPGDIIHVPSPETGLVYATGPGIARPGSYNIPANGRLTLQRLIATAGGFNAIGVPERVDLTRMVGDDRQATIRLNARAIAEGTHPDVFLKPDDLLNFGTDFWAAPFAVIRNGFRMSYGFGFLLDRNFGNDVFGAPPDNNNFN